MITSYVRNQIESAEIPKSWDGIVELPNELCIEKTISLVTLVYNSFEIIPDRISPMTDEGISFQYFFGDGHLTVDVGNDLEIAGVIVENKHIKTIVDINNDSDLILLFEEMLSE